MAKMELNIGADLNAVTEALWKKGIIVGRKLPDGRYVVYSNRYSMLCALYPELKPLVQQDRAFWKDVRRRTRNGENVSQQEIQTHAQQFKRQMNEIIQKHEKENRHPTIAL